MRVFASAFRSRRDLLLENLALRQQLATLVPRRRPLIRPADRAFWVALRRLWSGWADALVIVKPETVIRWHLAGFRLYWRWLSSRGKRGGRPAVAREVRDLIRRMATENLWGAPRIHGELLRLGFMVSERSVSRYLRTLLRRPERRQSWMTFLRNHREVIAAMDFFTVPTATFRIFYVPFVIRHRRREILHWNLTAHPTASWVKQQLREASPSTPQSSTWSSTAIRSSPPSSSPCSGPWDSNRPGSAIVAPGRTAWPSGSSARSAASYSTTPSC
jgi:putative transposase